MNGIVKWGFLSILGITLYSCGSENLYDPEKAGELKFARYEAAFIEKYGEINPNQDWGFGSVVTRSANPNSNQWSEYVKVPTDDDLTQDKISEIVKLFQNPKNAIRVDGLNWSDFFVQQVYFNPQRNNMNQLAAYKEDGTMDIVYNFNHSAGSIMFMQDSGTKDFSYEGEGGHRYGEHIIIFYEGDYYVGFDFECYMNQDTSPDGDYSDWIVRIKPAEYTSADRVMAEDLNDTNGDFDFNDVVFDAAIMNDGTTIITLQAAGGTMPLYIEGKEVHELFGVSETTMVNTQEGHKNAVPCVIFRLEGDYTDIKDILIAVNGVELRAEIGKAPGKLCCPTNCEWTDERENIEKRYQNFQSNIKTGVDWWK